MSLLELSFLLAILRTCLVYSTSNFGHHDPSILKLILKLFIILSTYLLPLLSKTAPSKTLSKGQRCADKMPLLILAKLIEPGKIHSPIGA